MSVIFYGCISLDGYLAGKDNDLTWLFESGSPEETEYEIFYNSMDITIMGRTTFDEINKMVSFKETYPTTKNYVFTSHDDINVEGAIAVSGNVAEFIKNIDESKNIWIVGGGGVLSPLLEENLVDKLFIQIAPVILGDGIPLFYKSGKMKRFTLLEVRKYGQFSELIFEKII